MCLWFEGHLYSSLYVFLVLFWGFFDCIDLLFLGIHYLFIYFRTKQDTGWHHRRLKQIVTSCVDRAVNRSNDDSINKNNRQFGSSPCQTRTFHNSSTNDFLLFCIWEFLVWPVTLTTLAQWQRTRELGQPITGSRQSCMSFLPRLQPAPCFVCLSAHQGWNLGVRRCCCCCWLDTNGGKLSRLPAHEDSGNRRGRTEQDRTGAPPGLWSQVPPPPLLLLLLDESLTRHFLPGDRDNLNGASSHILLPSLPFPSSPPPLPSKAAAHRPWPWWLCSALPPPVQHPRPARPTAVRGR